MSASGPKRTSVVCTGGQLAHHANPPRYAGPIFLRLQPQIEVTATFKQRKLELVKGVFNPSTIADPLYWLDPVTGRYERLDAALYADIVADGISCEPKHMERVAI